MGVKNDFHIYRFLKLYYCQNGFLEMKKVTEKLIKKLTKLMPKNDAKSGAYR
jgi:hypothetical protein